jgi:hypothetical protein
MLLAAIAVVTCRLIFLNYLSSRLSSVLGNNSIMLTWLGWILLFVALHVGLDATIKKRFGAHSMTIGRILWLTTGVAILLAVFQELLRDIDFARWGDSFAWGWSLRQWRSDELEFWAVLGTLARLGLSFLAVLYAVFGCLAEAFNWPCSPTNVRQQVQAERARRREREEAARNAPAGSMCTRTGYPIPPRK